MQNKPPKIDEKSLNILSCAVAVAVMILLMSGDMIITQFIKVKPNQLPEMEIPKEHPNEAEPPVSEPVYDVSFLTEITLAELVEKIEKKEDIFVFSGRETCPPCQRFLPILKETLVEANIKNAYYINRNLVKNDENYEKFLSYNELITTEFSSTPFLIRFINGHYLNGFVGFDGDFSTKENIKKLIHSSEG